ncbi:MAG TPA: S41 family peptidase [Gemmatimonadaceae bacterium]|nr:S41 family peptidase [Gemmatimonadaceae bacterium]
MRFRKLVAIAVLAAPLAAGAFVYQQRDTRDTARLLDQVMQLVSGRYVDTLGAAQLYEKAARGLVHELNDPYTTLLSPKEFQAFNTSSTGRYGGIGMEIAEVQGYVTVQKVFPNTPAEQGGVQEGDRIIVIDTTNVRGWNVTQVSEALRGPSGTHVNVRFSRPGVTEPIPVTFTRAIIHIPAVPYAMMLDGNVGYVPLIQFNETATRELAQSTSRLINEGAKALIIDLRGNPGGILDQSLSVSNMFLDRGQEIASVRGRSIEDQLYVAEESPLTSELPLVVLIDGRSASASEIVAGALQDHDRALVVGTTSFGKGLVQTVFQLSGGYALKMTTAKWYTPSGRSIQKPRTVLPNGQFAEEEPTERLGPGTAVPSDSLETEQEKRKRPQFRSDAGRIVYGGGAITPDVIVSPDTLTTAEQRLFQAIAPKTQAFAGALAEYARELRPQVQAGFTVQPEWREEFFRRIGAAGVTIDRQLYDAGAQEMDRILRNRIATMAFGDSTAKRMALQDDKQLVRALELVQQGQSQSDLFAIAQRLATAQPGRPQ